MLLSSLDVPHPICSPYLLLLLSTRAPPHLNVAEDVAHPICSAHLLTLSTAHPIYCCCSAHTPSLTWILLRMLPIRGEELAAGEGGGKAEAEVRVMLFCSTAVRLRASCALCTNTHT